MPERIFCSLCGFSKATTTHTSSVCIECHCISVVGLAVLTQESRNVIREGVTDCYQNSDPAAGNKSGIDRNFEIKLTKSGILLVEKG